MRKAYFDRMYPVATASQRIGAAILNCMVGGLPVGLPAMLDSTVEASARWSSAQTNLLAIALTLLQLAFVHFMQGSPGAVFLGLRVQNTDGTKPGFTPTLIRSMPYLSLVAITIVQRAIGAPIVPFSITAAALSVIVFLGVNGVTMMINGRQSLMDMMSQTKVVKVHKVI